MNADDRCESSTWMEVIVDFFENRVGRSKLFNVKKYIEDKSKELDDEKDEKKINRIKVAIDKKSKELIMLRKEVLSTEIRDWIDSTSRKKIGVGKRIVKTTHSLKFTHSSASNAGVLVTETEDDPVLTTASLKRPRVYDYAHNDGTLVTISRFFALEINGQSIYDCVLSDNFKFLEAFNESDEQLILWKDGLKSLIEDRKINTAELAKQTYYPIDMATDEYHILIPLFASTISEFLYKRVTETRFGDIQRHIRKYIENGKINKYHEATLEQFPNFAVSKYGGKNPQNVSMFNKGRTWKAEKKDRDTYGVSYFFNSAPPTWQSQLKPPIYKESLFFESSIHFKAKEDINYLRDFLLRFQNLDLSIKDPKREKWVERWVGNIIDEVFFYVASIQDLDPGWSASTDIKLVDEHQYLLDPYRADSEYQAARATAEWQPVICADFARWLNLKLAGKDKQFTPQAVHTRLWRKLFEPELRVFSEELEFNKKHNLEARI